MMVNVKRLKEELGEARKQKRDLVNERAEKIDTLEMLFNRSNPDQKEIEAKKTEIEDLKFKVEKQNKAIQDATDKVLDVGADPNWHLNQPDPSEFDNAFNGGSGPQTSKNVELWEAVSGDKKGQKIKVLGPRASLKAQQEHSSNDTRSMGDYLRDRVRGYTQSNSFSNDAMSTSVDSALVPTPLSTRLIDKARNKSRVMQAGARTVEMDSKTLTIAKTSKDAQVDWKKENDPHQSSEVGFEPLTFEAHTLIGSVKSSVELAEDSGNLASLVEDNLATQIALELDRAAMLGSGTDPEPTGIINTDGVQMKTLGSGDGAAISDYSEFSQAYQAILAANGMPNGVIYSPRTWGTLDRLTASDGQPLNAPQSYQNLAKYQTQQVPSDMTLGASDDASLAIVGDWSQCLIGVRTNIRLEVTRAGADSDSSAWENLQIWFRAYARYDVQIAHPEHFYVINGIVPAS